MSIFLSVFSSILIRSWLSLFEELTEKIKRDKKIIIEVILTYIINISKNYGLEDLPFFKANLLV